jgi:predicted CXXCH cytochrome family protein
MKTLKRFIVSIGFALLVTGVTYMIAQGKTASDSPVLQQQSSNCAGCHASIFNDWQSGKHSHANSDPLFTQMWIDQGKPGACLVCHVTGYDPALGTWKEEGVTCEACHPVPAEHLKSPSANPVPIDRTSDLCGRCHSGDRFNIENWQSSVHFQRGMSCTVCHDQHSATLKTVTGKEDLGPSGLCINCHSEVSMAFPYSKHSQSGVSCVDCHLRHFTAGSTDVHAMPDHSFTANISTCSSCHANQMHAEPTAEATAETTPTSQLESTATPQAVSSNPSPISPFGLAGLVGLIGLVGGMVIQPWMAKIYHKMNKKEVKK